MQMKMRERVNFKEDKMENRERRREEERDKEGRKSMRGSEGREVKVR